MRVAVAGTVGVLSAGLSLCAALPGDARAADGYFSMLAGGWTGQGSLTLVGGQTESIRCRATYTVDSGGDRIAQKMRCASDSYRFDITSSLSYNRDAGVVRGDWRDAENGVGGLVTGQARPGVVKAHVEGTGFSADIDVVTQSGRQTVSIRPKGANVSDVRVELTRS